MGNLCSSGSERVDNKEEKRVPERLKDGEGEGEALLPKFGAGVGLVTGEGSADVTSKVLENGQCGMPVGRSVCPEIVVSSSDVEPVVEDDDDDDFLNSVIAVVGDTTGRAITTARDVVAEIEARNLPQSDDAVVSFAEATPHGDGSVRDSVSVDYAGLGRSSRESVGAESANWAESVLVSATTAAQSALDGPSFAAGDFASDFTRKEDSPSLSVLGENSNNIVAMSSTVGDTVDEVAVAGDSAEVGQVSGGNSQPGTDSVSDISTLAEHRVENTLANTHDLNSDAAGSSASHLSGGVGSSVDGLVVEDEGGEQWVVRDASDLQDSPDLALTGTHEDGLGTSVDARVDFRDTQQRDGEMTAKTEAASSRRQHEQSDAGVVDQNSVVVVVSEEAENENQDEKPLEGTSGAPFCPPMMSANTREAETDTLDKSTPLAKDDIFAGWSVVSDTDFLKYVKSDDEINHEAAARDIVESIIARASSIVSGTEDSVLSYVGKEESMFEDKGADALLAFLTDRFASPPELPPSSPQESDQRQPAGGDSSTSSISQGDLIEREELLIPPVSPLNVVGESRSSHIFGSSEEDIDDATIKQTAWSITDMAVQEAIKIVAGNVCQLNEDFNQPHNNDLDLYPNEDATIDDESNSELSETSPNNNTESPTQMKGVNCLPEYSAQTGLTSDHQQSARPETTPAEKTLAHPTSHTNQPLENDLTDIPDNSTHASPLIPSDTEFISSSSPPISNGEHGDSDSITATSTQFFSKVPSFLPPLDNNTLPGKPVIIINSPDSAANTGSNEDISVHTEALI